MTPPFRQPARICVLMSGGGRTLLNLEKACQEGQLPATVVQVISSKRESVGNDRAKNVGLNLDIADRAVLDETSFQQRITKLVDASDPDLVVMAGFLWLWQFPDRYEGRVVNIHPSLLPRHGGKGMHGMRVHEAVLSSGDRQSGCTVHLCNHQYDRGPVVLQRVVDVDPGMTATQLADRVFEEECKAYPQALRQLILERDR